ncbi:TRAFAC clade GTPase domain-containing protein [Nocardiopsis salina]|uniref:TRAFAC clade GTPase domain-containing protein n=1 Tax=Nocardiopsis salina TaxID=245836 RepID=UPI00034CBF08|nr:hypothetical protein [Nocardiopsis salina]
MPQLILVILAIVLVVWLVWLALALLVRAVALILVGWILLFVGGIAGGVVRGVFLPPSVLAGNTEEIPSIATPDGVVKGRVLGKAPRGHAKYLGWDRAWPVYIPHQAGRDANAVLAAAKRIGLESLASAFAWWVTGVLFSPALVGFALGLWASVLTWYAVMTVLGALVFVGQGTGVVAYRWYDHLARRSIGADLRCVSCYRVTVVPSYRCPGASCSTIHNDVRPGPLGIVHRQCGCGTRIPATVGRAAARLVTVCPFCDTDAPDGSGTRQVLPLPVIGAVSAGKTQFLTSGVVELRDRAEVASGSLTPISPVAEDFLKTSRASVFSGRRVSKTAWEDRPEGIPLVLSHGGAEIEVQIMDAAGENFVGWERSQSLGYIDTASTLLFVLDPLALPEVREQLRRSGEEGAVPLAQGDQEGAYAAVVDRLRAEGVALGPKHLCVVLTKLDILRKVPGTVDRLDPANGASVKGWLREHGGQRLVRRINGDFRNVDYYAVDSLGSREGTDPSHPVQVLDRALRVADRRMAVLPEPESVPAGEARNA